MGRSNQGMRFLPLSQSTVKGLDRNGLKEELGERRLLLSIHFIFTCEIPAK